MCVSDVVSLLAFQLPTKQHPRCTHSISTCHNTQESLYGHLGSPSSSCLRVLLFVLVVQVIQVLLVLSVNTVVPLLFSTQEIQSAVWRSAHVCNGRFVHNSPDHE